MKEELTHYDADKLELTYVYIAHLCVYFSLRVCMCIYIYVCERESVCVSVYIYIHVCVYYDADKLGS